MKTKPKIIYEHTQRMGWLLWGPIIIVFSVAAYFGFGYRQYEGFLVFGILLVIGYLYGSLTVAVDSERLRFHFGPGLIRKSFQLAEIASCRVVRNKWYYGGGIHMTPNGTIYNVAGRDGIELLLVSGRKTRIGTDEPQKLCDAVNRLVQDEEKHRR
jgi:hypothetical protein